MLLEIKNATYTYPAFEGENPVPAVDRVSLCVNDGDFVAILGSNGSGKSTLAKLMNGIFLPAKGSVKVAGMDTADDAHINDIRRKAGLVFQNPDNQIVSTIVEEDCAFGPENLGIPPAEIRQRVDEALKAVGLYEYRKREPHKLSGGQKQRLAIAGMLAMRPRLLILDEPTAMLDPQGRREVLRTLAELRRQHGIAIIMITHYMNEAALADRVVVMEGGRITLDGTPREVFARREKIERAGLSLPICAEISLELAPLGFPFCITPEEIHIAVENHREFAEKIDNIVDRFVQKSGNFISSDEITLTAENLTHTYTQNSAEGVHAIRGIDLVVRQGECLGIIGHTGSGKSTLIQHFNALLEPTQGRILLDGQDINDSKKSRWSSRFAVGLCFQYPENQLFAETVRQDIAFGPHNQGIKETEKLVENAAKLVGLDLKLLEKSPFDLSGGEKRRAALAGVIAMKPRILVLDEPAAGLDPRGKLHLRETIRQYRRETGGTVIIVSHAMEEIASLCDRVLVLDHGKRAILGTCAEVFAQGDKLADLGLELPDWLGLKVRNDFV